MQHPDKADGPRTRARARFPVILHTLLLGFFLGIAGLPSSAETAVLREFRMGDHDQYLRLVFEFSAPAKYDLSENGINGVVSIRFLDTISQLPKNQISDSLQCVDTVSTVQDGNHVVTTISFNPKSVRLKPFTIQEPDRVVLDLFCGEDPPTAVVLPEPPVVQPAPTTSSQAMPSEEKPLTVPAYVKPPQSPRVSPPQKDDSQKYLLLMLAAITGIIVFIIALIFFQKKNLHENHTHENPGVTRDDEVMRAIDSKIKEKFMRYDE